MVKPARSHQEEEEEDEEDLGARTDGSSQRDGKNSEQRANTPRSKHSATEQRRRSKINERFQILRDLIPQNDQKRDKASFLLEVIQYVQFLQDKVQMYEGSYQGWSLEPTKLIPWRNNRGPVESFIEQSQIVKNDYGHENNAVASPAMLTNAHNSVESDLVVAAVLKAMDHTPGQAIEEVPPNMPLQPTLPLHGSLSNAENIDSQTRSQLWQARPCTTECAVPSNAQEELASESGADSISNAYSQGLLTTLTRALQSSGVDLSQANISVQIDVGKRANSGQTATTTNPKYAQAEKMETHSGVGSLYENSDEQVHKRLRTQNI